MGRALLLVLAKVFLDPSYPFCIIELVENSFWSAAALLPLFFFWGSHFCSSSSATTKNIPFRINYLQNADSVSLFF
jgi:hypothetical protein